MAQSPEVKPSGLVACGPSRCHTMMVKAQCQTTTTSRLKARMKSMNAYALDGPAWGRRHRWARLASARR